MLDKFNQYCQFILESEEIRQNIERISFVAFEVIAKNSGYPISNITVRVQEVEESTIRSGIFYRIRVFLRHTLKNKNFTITLSLLPNTVSNDLSMNPIGDVGRLELESIYADDMSINTEDLFIKDSDTLNKSLGQMIPKVYEIINRSDTDDEETFEPIPPAPSKQPRELAYA